MNNGGVRDDPSIPQQPAGRVSVKTALVVVSVLLIMFAYTQLEGQFKMASSVQKEIEDANITWMQDHDRRNLEMLLETNCTFVESVSVATFEARNRLEQYWNISNYPNFKSMMNIPEESWSIQKAKFVKLILEAGSNRAASQSTMEAHKPKEITLNFIVGFSGSSVTAGHGTWNKTPAP